MTDLARVVVNLTGWSGAPGVNVLHFSQGSNPTWDTATITDMCDEIVAMHEATRSYWAPGVTAQLRPEVDIIDSASGNIIDQISPSPAFGPIVSTGTSGTLSRATQILIRFKGDRWVNGRRIAGRMFMGPAAGGVFSAAGTINSAVVAAIEDSFEAMTSGVGTRLAVYSRPNPALNRDGDWTDVVTVQCSSTPAVLRKRRD